MKKDSNLNSTWILYKNDYYFYCIHFSHFLVELTKTRTYLIIWDPDLKGFFLWFSYFLWLLLFYQQTLTYSMTVGLVWRIPQNLRMWLALIFAQINMTRRKLRSAVKCGNICLKINIWSFKQHYAYFVECQFWNGF